ncbi:CD209 antigen-like protein D isoform X1 [Syngnathus acus]|uniref:CD209 antigen-like protein D isoform X1 n=1 Tax=Syngnathus acus TaxID=161584 RepID=UPI0018860F75|nr:CD209 antigen-like protein D isoform X1 [Syngnathus acus]
MESEPRATEHTVSYAPKSSQVSFNRSGPPRSHYGLFGQGVEGRNRVVILCLGFLDVILLIIAVVFRTGFTQHSNANPQPAAPHLIAELDLLLGNHSDAMVAMQEAVNALNKATRSHEKLKGKINEQKTMNEVYQSQLESLRRERKILQFNMSSFEGTCGKCNKGWTYFNSSCYYFSFTNSSSTHTWKDSRNDCINRGADLIVIDYPNEQSYVNHISQFLNNRFYLWEKAQWIGVTEGKTEGTWVWINNATESEERYWKSGEPNSFEKNCVATIYSPAQPWETRFVTSCDLNYQWICEMAPK